MNFLTQGPGSPALWRKRRLCARMDESRDPHLRTTFHRLSNILEILLENFNSPPSFRVLSKVHILLAKTQTRA